MGVSIVKTFVALLTPARKVIDYIVQLLPISMAAPKVQFEPGKDNPSSGKARKNAKKVRIKTKEDEFEKEDDIISVNPFSVPKDKDIFVIREEQRITEQRIRRETRKLPAHMKTTYLTDLRSRLASRFRSHLLDDNPVDATILEDIRLERDPDFAVAVTWDKCIERETLAQYIDRKKNIFLLEYNMGVQQDEIRRLQALLEDEERRLILAEMALERDAIGFDEFLKENDSGAMNAIKSAENEAKMRLDKVIEIKRLSAMITQLKVDVTKHEDTLREYRMYRTFLEEVAYQGWKKERPGDAENQEATKAVKRRSARPKSGGFNKGPQAPTFYVATPLNQLIAAEADPPVPFQSAMELLNIYSELEEQNLSLIQHSQETEEALDDIKRQVEIAKNRMAQEAEMLQEEINNMHLTIEAEQKKTEELDLVVKMFNFGDSRAEDQDEMLLNLQNLVGGLYKSCIGENEANISTLQMLTCIESRFEEMVGELEMQPPEAVAAVEKAHEKERRQKQREEKIKQQKAEQEEKLAKAFLRSHGPVKKKNGRHLVFRSEPPRPKLRMQKLENIEEEEEDLTYYFQ